MNTLNFNQTDGFPLTTEILGNMQNSYSIFNQFCNLISSNPSKKYIISGCENVGNTVTNGFVCIGNEILPFKGGTKQTYVHIKETITKRKFEDETLKPVDKIREVVFGGNQYKWEDFQSIPDMEGFETENKLIRKQLNFLEKGFVFNLKSIRESTIEYPAEMIQGGIRLFFEKKNIELYVKLKVEIFDPLIFKVLVVSTDDRTIIQDLNNGYTIESQTCFGKLYELNNTFVGDIKFICFFNKDKIIFAKQQSIPAGEYYIEFKETIKMEA